MYKVMFSVTEASGDLHGGSVAAALKKIQPDICMFGVGGQAMKAAGVDIVQDIAELGVMGLVEVVKKLPQYFRLKAMLAELMDKERPDVLVLIDSPDFNLKFIAKIAKQKGIPVLYYIGPTVWIWRKGRVQDMARNVEKLAAIFPFEAQAYAGTGANVSYVGNPLLDIVKTSMSQAEAYRYFKADKDRPLLLLLPGSRKQEIAKLLPVMLAAAEKIREQLPNCQFFLPVASTISQEMLQDIMQEYQVPVTLTQGKTYDLMSIANAAIAASGTVILEAALLNLPTVVIYKVAALTYFLGKKFVKIPFVSLPNMVAGREILPELLQQRANGAEIAAETLRILMDSEKAAKIKRGLAEVQDKLGQGGAVDRVAREILHIAQNTMK